MIWINICIFEKSVLLTTRHYIYIHLEDSGAEQRQFWNIEPCPFKKKKRRRTMQTDWGQKGEDCEANTRLMRCEREGEKKR